MSEPSEVLIAAVGDVFLNRENPAQAFHASASFLAAADLRFGNCEGVYTDRAVRAPSAGFAVVAPSRTMGGLGPAQFDVMSLANNHTIDAGHEGLSDTLCGLRAHRVYPVGAGQNRAEARAPVIIERGGRRIAVLAFTSVYQPGYESRECVPGVAAMRAHWSYYYPDWDPYGRLEPGSRPHVRTFAYPEDLCDFRELINSVRTQADVVIVSFHWGDSSRPAFLHDYEREYGRCAIDSGADVVFGHHHHFLRAVELYRGKPIFYGLGHFAFDLPGLEAALTPAALARLHQLGEYAIYPRPGSPRFPFHPDARLTMIAFCEINRDAAKAWVVPCIINSDNDPIPFDVDSSEGGKVLEYLDKITRHAGLNTRYVPDKISRTGFSGLSIQFA